VAKMKMQEMREKTIDELQELIIDSKKQLFELRLQKSLNKLEDTSKMAKTRKLVAKAKTVINEKSRVGLVPPEEPQKPEKKTNRKARIVPSQKSEKKNEKKEAVKNA